MRNLILTAVAAFALAPAAQAADAVHGRNLFREQCGLCHAAGPGDGEVGMGPDLAGVVGRHVAGDPGFGYTPALKALDQTWSEAALDKFLTDPQAVAPGTSMPISLADPKDRADVISYLASVKK
jgi:cytochrome c